MPYLKILLKTLQRLIGSGTLSLTLAALSLQCVYFVCAGEPFCMHMREVLSQETKRPFITWSNHGHFNTLCMWLACACLMKSSDSQRPFVANVAAFDRRFPSNHSSAKDRTLKGHQLINVHRCVWLIRTIIILIVFLLKKGFLPSLLLWHFSALFGLNIN